MSDPDATPRIGWLTGSGRVTPDELAEKIKRTPFPAEAVMSKIVLVAQANSQKRTPVHTGHLRRSLTTRIEPDGLKGYVGSNVRYAAFVHDGTENPDGSVRMKARPFIKEGIEDSHPRIVQILADAGEGYLEDIAKA